MLTEASLSGPQEHLLKMQKQKLQLPQQAPPPQAPPGPPPPSAQVPVQPPPPAPQQSPQLTTVTASRPGALLTGTTVANLQVARLVSPPSPSMRCFLRLQPVVFELFGARSGFTTVVGGVSPHTPKNLGCPGQGGSTARGEHADHQASPKRSAPELVGGGARARLCRGQESCWGWQEGKAQAWEASPCCRGEVQRGQVQEAAGAWGGPRPPNQAPSSQCPRHEETSEAGSGVGVKAASAAVSHIHAVPIQPPIRPASVQPGDPCPGTDDSPRRQPRSCPGTAPRHCACHLMGPQRPLPRQA